MFTLALSCDAGRVFVPHAGADVRADETAGGGGARDAGDAGEGSHAGAGELRRDADRTRARGRRGSRAGGDDGHQAAGAAAAEGAVSAAAAHAAEGGGDERGTV